MTYKTLRKPTRPNKQIQEYVEAFSKGGRLVMPNKEGQWRTTGPNGSKSLVFKTKEEAVAKAKQELAGSDSKVFVFDENGELISQLRAEKSARRA